MKIVTVTHSTGEQLPILLDSSGMPIVLPNEFILSRRFLSSNTLTRNLRELATLYQWLYDNDIDLHKRFESPRLFTEAELKGSLIEALRIKSSQSLLVAVKPNTFNQRLTTVRQFFSWAFDTHSSQLPFKSNEFERIRANKDFVLKYLDNSFMAETPEVRSLSKGLSDEQAAFLLEVLDPLNKNGFGRNTAVKYRNYLSVALMIYCGIRPGELLSLRVEDISIGAISSVNVARRPPDPYDTRQPRPSIKRNGRVIPLDDRHMVSCLDQYIVLWREKLEEHSTVATEYLILSDEGSPLSHSSLIQFFQILRSKFPDTLPINLTAKSLRHRFSSQLEKELRRAGYEEHRRREALAYMRGDSSLNSQDTYIAQEIQEMASTSLKRYQRKILEK